MAAIEDDNWEHIRAKDDDQDVHKDTPSIQLTRGTFTLIKKCHCSGKHAQSIPLKIVPAVPSAKPKRLLVSTPIETT